jgi:myosin heavy subunit
MKKVWIPTKDTGWELVNVLSVGTEPKEEDISLTVSMPVAAKDGGVGRLSTTASVQKNTTRYYDPSHSLDVNDLDDLCLLNHLHEAPLLDCLHRRYKEDLIYTSIGSNILVCINPYKMLPSLHNDIQPYLDYAQAKAAVGVAGMTNGSGGMAAASAAPGDGDSDSDSSDAGEAGRERARPPRPHVYKVAAEAQAELARSTYSLTRHTGAGKSATATAATIPGTGRNQSILMSGVSGSGKTEASKYVLQFLIQQEVEEQKYSALNNMTCGLGSLRFFGTAKKATNAATIMTVVEQSTAIFEAFGNATTVHNDNSSRFGKYMKLQYSVENRLVSACTETFLLERSRLLYLGEKERNFHVFYSLFDGYSAGHKLCAEFKVLSKDTLQLSTPQQFKMLCDSRGALTPCGKVGYLDTLSAAFTSLGCSSHEQVEIWSLLAALLHLGNIRCESVINEALPQIDDNYCRVELESPSMSLSDLTQLLGVSSLTFEARLMTRRVQVGNRQSIHVKQLDAKTVMNNIRALIRWVYSNLFTWVVKKINFSHCSTANASIAPPKFFIGILDIFGFESLESNSLEQLCINFTNERLQLAFNECVFEREQNQYKGMMHCNYLLFFYMFLYFCV